jgi:thioredoxin reductase (NADPH)
LHLVVRKSGLEATMSRYLIDRIEALPNVALHAGIATAVGEGAAVVAQIHAALDWGAHL